jgi:hypothetical protein
MTRSVKQIIFRKTSYTEQCVLLNKPYDVIKVTYKFLTKEIRGYRFIGENGHDWFISHYSSDIWEDYNKLKI